MSPKLSTFLLVLGLLAYGFHSAAQPKVTWSSEFKERPNTFNITVLHADTSGIYLWEEHTMTWDMFVKMTPDFTEVYRYSQDQLLKDRYKTPEQLLFLRDRLYVFSRKFSDKTRSTILEAAEIDKNTGSLKSDWKQVAEWKNTSEFTPLKLSISSNSDSSGMVVTGLIQARDRNTYDLWTVDPDLHSAVKPISISNEFEPKLFAVEDFISTPTGNAILVGRVSEYEEGKKEKDKNIVFKNYSIRLYNPKGKVIRNIKTDYGDKFLVTTRVIQQKDELVLLAFFSDGKNRKEINGLLVQRINPITGEILSTIKQPMTNALVSPVDGDEVAQNRKKDKQNDQAGIEGTVVFRNVYLAPDKGLVILAEEYHGKATGGTTNLGMGGHDMYSETHNMGNIYMFRISPGGTIDWMHVLPKQQTEFDYLGTTGAGMGSGYYKARGSLPYYAGFSSMATNNTLHLFFNDDEANATVLQSGTKPKKIGDYGNSTCYMVDLDMTTGVYTRKPLFSNRDIPTAMPRLTVIIKNDIYMTGKINSVSVLKRKKLAIGRISF